MATTTASSSSAVAVAVVDPKLLHLVRKLLPEVLLPPLPGDPVGASSSSSSATTTTATAGSVVALLRSRHREYARKDPSLLTDRVAAAVRRIQQRRVDDGSIDDADGDGDGSIDGGCKDETAANKRVRKRTRRQRQRQESRPPAVVVGGTGGAGYYAGANGNGDGGVAAAEEEEEEEDDDDDDDDDEVLYDRRASENDSFRERIGIGGSLNASLRNRYRQLSSSAARSNSNNQRRQQSCRRQRPSERGEKDPGGARERGRDPISKRAGEDDALMAAETRLLVSNDDGEEEHHSVVVTGEDTAVVVNDRDSGIAAANTEGGAAVAAKLSGRRPPKSSLSTTVTTTTSSNSPAGSTKRSSKMRRLSRSASTSRGYDSNSNNDAFASSSSSPSFLSPVHPRPSERYADLGGLEDAVRQLRQLVEYPLLRPELYRHLGVDPPRGVLLRGPPGCGKSHLANSVAGELGVPYYRVSAPETVSGMSGESEGRIRDLFRIASDTAPSLIFLDELDAIAPKRSDASGARGMEKRMVAQLLTSMDAVSPRNNRNEAPVMVLAATNRPDALDSALRRAGRFDKEILLGVPDEDAREKIIRTVTKAMRLDGDFNYKQLARKTPGFVGADIQSLAKEAAVLAIDRIYHNVLNDGNVKDQHPRQSDVKAVEANAHINKLPDDAPKEPSPVSAVVPLSEEQMEPLYITMDDFLNAVPLVQPSSKREGFATVSDVTWEDIGALQSIREELAMSVLEPIRNPEKFQALGLSLPAGVLLYGPPGCGKTLLAKAIAHESGANFISVKGPELLDKYVGESERAVRLVFDRARSSSPCVVFFDELDSLVPRRGSDSGGGGVSERVVNQLLTELDGLESRRSVFVIAATNRPELIDPAMMRPGRLDKLLYVPLPTPGDRVSILKALAVNIVLGDDVDFDAVGRSPRTDGYSGADCAALIREAGLAVLREDAAAPTPGAAALSICSRHFDRAFDSVMPSVSKKDQARYDRIRDKMARARTRSVADENDDAAVVAPARRMMPAAAEAAIGTTGAAELTNGGVGGDRQGDRAGVPTSPIDRISGLLSYSSRE